MAADCWLGSALSSCFQSSGELSLQHSLNVPASSPHHPKYMTHWLAQVRPLASAVPAHLLNQHGHHPHHGRRGPGPPPPHQGLRGARPHSLQVHWPLVTVAEPVAEYCCCTLALSPHLFSSSTSLNAAVFSAVCLASRYCTQLK